MKKVHEILIYYILPVVTWGASFIGMGLGLICIGGTPGLLIGFGLGAGVTICYAMDTL